MASREINKAGLALIKAYEGFRSAPYQDSAGVWTIGFGSTKGVTKDTPPISMYDGELLLDRDLKDAEQAVENLIKVPLTDNQFAALVSLVYNCGQAPLLKTLGTKLNKGDYLGAAHEFSRWNRAGGIILKGLTRRREDERKLFLTE
jgi:GH24 family phage-related lysozyme (muramidase)